MYAAKSFAFFAFLGALALSFPASAEGGMEGGIETQGQLWPVPQFRMQYGDVWSVKTRGRMEIDAAHIDDDNAGHKGGIRDRRMRLGLEFGYGENWTATAELDFSTTLTSEGNFIGEEENAYTDMVLEYDNRHDMRLQFGHFKEAFGMERTASSAHSLFIERAAVDVFTPQRNLGAQGVLYGERGSLSLGAFTDSMQSNSNKDKFALTSRATYSWPVMDDAVLHLGAAGSWRRMEQVAFASTPDTSTTDIDVVDAGTLHDVDTMWLGGLEAGYGWRNTLLRGEYMTAHLERETAEDATLDGWYVQASWLLSGEDYQYSAAKDALFQPVKPARPFDLKQGAWGAWELGARYQVLSLSDASVRGGEMRAVTGGVNWYPNTHWRISANLTAVNTDDEAATPQDDPIIAAMRIRLAF